MRTTILRYSETQRKDSIMNIVFIDNEQQLAYPNADFGYKKKQVHRQVIG
ncbi:MAG: hypothetical protein ACK4R1_13875 [Flavobacterium sp.]